MLKRIFAVRRRDGVDHDKLVAAWEGEHVANVVADMDPDRYAVTFFRQRPDSIFDGMAALGFEDGARGRAQFTPTDPPRASASDELSRSAGKGTFIFDATERVMADGPRGPFKSVVFVTKKPGVPMADFAGHWLEVHAPNAINSSDTADGGFRYVTSIGHDLPDDARFHGITEVYYDNSAAWKAHGARIRPDGFDEVAIVAPDAFFVGRELLVR